MSHACAGARHRPCRGPCRCVTCGAARAQRLPHAKRATRRWRRCSSPARSCLRHTMPTTSSRRSCCSGCAGEGCVPWPAWRPSVRSAPRRGTRARCSSLRATILRAGPSRRSCAGRPIHRMRTAASIAIICGWRCCQPCASAGRPPPPRQEGWRNSRVTRWLPRPPAWTQTCRRCSRVVRSTCERCSDCRIPVSGRCSGPGSPGSACPRPRRARWPPCATT